MNIHQSASDAYQASTSLRSSEHNLVPMQGDFEREVTIQVVSPVRPDPKYMCPLSQQATSTPTRTVASVV